MKSPEVAPCSWQGNKPSINKYMNKFCTTTFDLIYRETLIHSDLTKLRVKIASCAIKGRQLTSDALWTVCRGQWICFRDLTFDDIVGRKVFTIDDTDLFNFNCVWKCFTQHNSWSFFKEHWMTADLGLGKYATEENCGQLLSPANFVDSFSLQKTTYVLIVAGLLNQRNTHCGKSVTMVWKNRAEEALPWEVYDFKKCLCWHVYLENVWEWIWMGNCEHLLRVINSEKFLIVKINLWIFSVCMLCFLKLILDRLQCTVLIHCTSATIKLRCIHVHLQIISYKFCFKRSWSYCIFLPHTSTAKYKKCTVVMSTMILFVIQSFCKYYQHLKM